MKRVKYFGLEENVWKPDSWNGEGITKLWSKKLYRLYAYLFIEVNINKIVCMENSQKGEIRWMISTIICNFFYLKVIEFAKDGNF